MLNNFVLQFWKAQGDKCGQKSGKSVLLHRSLTKKKIFLFFAFSFSLWKVKSSCLFVERLRHRMATRSKIKKFYYRRLYGLRYFSTKIKRIFLRRFHKVFHRTKDSGKACGKVILFSTQGFTSRKFPLTVR